MGREGFPSVQDKQHKLTAIVYAGLFVVYGSHSEIFVVQTSIVPLMAAGPSSFSLDEKEPKTKRSDLMNAFEK